MARTGWNRRPLEEPIHREISAIVDPYRGTTPSYCKEETWSEPLMSSRLFQHADERTFANVQVLEEEGLVDRVQGLGGTVRQIRAPHQRPPC